MENKQTPWRKFLEEEGICRLRDGKALCDKGCICMDCLTDEVFYKYLEYKKKNNIPT